ncbi:uncharacterized protein LOC118762153 [Octopus sinensis]|uniref:Uncharacterized protein LOC118762153 n=1 Tax=Octopus sinensis TaxID=2607531 RepID=A0A7E6ENT5_9MOLL|nr:uncharacterized protein LOC118762153 [Octopus sinensis]
MEMIELTTSELWKTKFVELQKTLGRSCLEKSVAIFNCWMSLFERFNSLKKISYAFGSTYTCKQIFSHMKSVLSPQRSCLTIQHLEACIKLKVTNYAPDIEKLIKNVQGQGSH